MDLPLILAAGTTVGSIVYKVLAVLIGVNLLIIVHEWGHFIVARMCGVKCEKFYIWFDIFGLKLFKFRWGDTEYGFGVLPLGGYVKMLGQEDNPARLREELEKAKARQADPNAAQDSEEEDPDHEPLDIEAAEAALYAPDSYLSKSVPQRMAIISAGVIMNVVFALFVAVLAYCVGVTERNCGVGDLAPGRAGWRAGLKTGDRIEAINGQKALYFDQVVKTMQVGDIDDGVALVVRRPGVEEPLNIKVQPDRDWLIPSIGVASPWLPVLRGVDDEKQMLVGYPGTAAWLASPKLQGGDRIVQVGDAPVEIYRDVFRQQALNPDAPLTLTVERPAPVDPKAKADAEPNPPERLTVEVPPQPMRWFGLLMEMGPVTGIRQGSPAEAAGIEPGDRITALGGEEIENPMKLPDMVRRLAVDQTEVTLTIQPADGSDPVEKTMPLARPVNYYEPLRDSDGVVLAPLGVAYQVTNRVSGVTPGTPADKKGLKAGDVIQGIRLLAPPKETIEEYKELDIPVLAKDSKKVIKLDGERASWAGIFGVVQKSLEGTKLELTLEDERTVELAPVLADDWNNPNRGFTFEPDTTIVQADGAAQALALGWNKTYESLTMVFQFLGKLGTQVSPKAMGGPVTIVKVAYMSAGDFSKLLIFLCMISANLAVLNILPIPVLDGGHMMFLLYEGIRRKPPSEAVFVGLSYLGLLFILSLMFYVLALDFGFISRF